MADMYEDGTFDPQNSFMFQDESYDSRAFGNRPRNVAALNESHAHLDIGDSFVDPAYDTNASKMGSWAMEGSSMDYGQGSSVVHQYGQITPPNDSTPGGLPTAKASVPGSVQSGTSKSERARNAANQRHSKAKKAKEDSIRKVEGPDDDQEPDCDESKREKYREKNRVAAAKCRAKKKTNTEDLEDSARLISATNKKLKAEERELRNLFSSLRHQALVHDPSEGCTCTSIHMYNSNKAQEAARGAAQNMGSYSLPSPSIDSEPAAATASPRDGFNSRAQSCSGSLAFLPPTTSHDMMQQQSMSTFSPMMSEMENFDDQNFGDQRFEDQDMYLD